MWESDDQRFIRVFTQGMLRGSEIWVDRQTGVQYLFHQSGYAGGLTVLLDAEGKPLISPEYQTGNAYGNRL